MQIQLKIQRFDPEKDEKPAFKTYPLDVDPSERVLDALLYVKTYIDGTLGVRKSCAHGVCGSDAMLINGVSRLACKTLVQDVAQEEGAEIVVEPMRHLPVQKDLMVDQSRFFENYRSVKPFLISEEEPGEREFFQSPDERSAFDDPTKCILCAACYSACPVLDKNPDFIGPAAIVQAARFNFDSRDRGFEERLQALDTPDGVWACENHFECTKVCPRDIKVTKNINLTKRAITKWKEGKEA